MSADSDARFTRLRLLAIDLGRELADPAFDALALSHLPALRAELAARVGAPPERKPSSSSPAALALKLDSLVTIHPELAEFRLDHLQAVRDEVGPIVRPGASARMLANDGMQWQAAADIAERLAGDLAAATVRCKVAGSIRRRRARVSDIEIVAEARTRSDGLFGEPTPDTEIVRGVVAGWGRLVKSGERYMRAELPEGLFVDVFLVSPPAQWGSILAIRTGPWELGREAVSRLKAYGLRHVEGHVLDAAGMVIPTPTEEAFFALCGLPCVPPSKRDYEQARVPLSAAQRAAAIERAAGALEAA